MALSCAQCIRAVLVAGVCESAIERALVIIRQDFSSDQSILITFSAINKSDCGVINYCPSTNQS